MTTSGTFTYDPSLGELTLYAFNLCGVRNTAILQEHMTSARMAANLLLASWSNKGVNLWAVDLVTLSVTPGVSTYTVDPSTIMILDAYMSVTTGLTSVDRVILPISRTEYASYPNKSQSGLPTVFWFDRLISPTITVWPVPAIAGTLKYYRVRRLQDAEMQRGQTVEIPYRWLDAFADGMAYRLARVWAPQLAEGYKAVADESYGVAAAQDTENVNMYISPMLGGYYR